MIAYLRYLLFLVLAGSIFDGNVSAYTNVSDSVKLYNDYLEKASRMEGLAMPDSALYFYNKISALPLSSHILATNYLKVGDIYRTLSRFRDAELQIAKFDSLYLSLIIEDSLLIAQRDYLYGKLLSNKGEFERASPYFNKSYELKVKILGPDAPALAKVHNFKGINYYFQGKYDLAMNEYNQAHRIC
jgi:tetratricopeptide (TPR) repeat protein